MHRLYLIVIILITTLLISGAYDPLDIEFLKKQAKVEKKSINSTPMPKNPSQKKKTGLPSFEDAIKDFEEIPGLFTVYWDKDKNKFLMELTPSQLDKIYLANLTRKSGDAYYYDGGSMLWEFPFVFQRLNDIIQLVHINTSFRADESSAIHKSIDNNFSNSIIATGKIISDPHIETEAILFDANVMFVRDISYVSQQRQGKYRFDKNNSFVSDLQSYPENTEIQIKAHFTSAKWTDSYTLPNSHSMTHTYHISLLDMPNSDFTPRIADDRVGYFTTIYQDYTSTLRETPYVRYINRWNLQKKYPDQALSEPIEPIVYWLENTIPQEFRQAVRDGILAWNKAFEKIGFKNAIIAKQMPDDATWHPGDSRYNTIRWIVQPQSGYAVGPSRANPFTGELYDADIRISADFTRAFYREFDEFVTPVTTDDPISLWKLEEEEHTQSCNYANHLHEQMILSWHSLVAQGHIENTQSALYKYVYQGLVDLVLHEVGHTLGLRHNFKASSIFSIEQLSDPSFTSAMGISGSVMDYHPVSLLDNGNTMFQTFPGPYDDWAIAYGYSTCPHSEAKLPAVYEDNKIFVQNESICLENIAKRSNEPYLTYGTDEDAFGLSSRGIDPLCNVWDMSSNPIAYYDQQLDLVQKLWDNLLQDFEKKGNRYQKIRSVFSQGIGEYWSASRTAAKFIGGIYFSRNHIGDPNQKMPLVVAEASKQREALSFINNRIFHKNAFNFDKDLLSKLSPERHEDFRGYVWRMDRLDYPLHSIIKSIQSNALYSVFHPRRILRLQDNELKAMDDDIFTMVELFNTVNSMIWEEVVLGENINSYRRELQKSHIDLLRVIMLDIYNITSFPNDAKILARSNLKSTLKNIYSVLTNTNLDEYTLAHLENAAEDIESILEAKINFN